MTGQDCSESVCQVCSRTEETDGPDSQTALDDQSIMSSPNNCVDY